MQQEYMWPNTASTLRGPMTPREHLRAAIWLRIRAPRRAGKQSEQSVDCARDAPRPYASGITRITNFVNRIANFGVSAG